MGWHITSKIIVKPRESQDQFRLHRRLSYSSSNGLIYTYNLYTVLNIITQAR